MTIVCVSLYIEKFPCPFICLVFLSPVSNSPYSVFCQLPQNLFLLFVVVVVVVIIVVINLDDLELSI